MEEEMNSNIESVKRDDVTNYNMPGLEPDVIKFIHDPNPILTGLEYNFGGWVYNQNTQQWTISKFIQPTLNEIGVINLIGDMKSRINLLTTLSKLDKNEINTLLFRYGEYMRLWMWRHQEEWGMTTDIDSTRIMNLLVDTYKKTLNRALEGWSGNALTKVYQKTDILQTRPTEKKGLRKLIPWG